MRNRHLLLIIVALFNCFGSLNAQDLMDLLEEETKSDEKSITSAIFKGSRVIHGHSVKTKKKGELEFLIMHRFGTINSGAREFWGLDDSNIRLAFEYAITDMLNTGIARNSFQKTFDGFIKYKLISQQDGAVGSPVSAVVFVSGTINSQKSQRIVPSLAPGTDFAFKNRMVYTYQLLVGRKFNRNFSLQIVPTLVHKNLINFLDDDNDIIALGMGARYMITKSVAINLEYYYQLNPNKFQSSATTKDDYRNSLAIGVDIETGGHVFQLHLSNSTAMIEKAFITETSDEFFRGDIHFGFNISRTFQLGK